MKGLLAADGQCDRLNSVKLRMVIVLLYFVIEGDPALFVAVRRRLGNIYLFIVYLRIGLKLPRVSLTK